MKQVPPSNATIQLDAVSNNLPTNFMEWVRFHNGVAAGLRVSPRVDVDDDTDQSAVDDLTRTWISYNRLKTNTSSGEGKYKAKERHANGAL